MQLGLILFIFAVTALIILKLPQFLAAVLEFFSVNRNSRNIPSEREFNQTTASTRLWVTIVITLVVLFSGLYIILFRSDNVESQKWAFGAVGTIIGFWLK